MSKQEDGSVKEMKCHFTNKIQEEFPFIRPCRQSQDDTMVHCTLCQSSFSIASGANSGGRFSVVEHQRAKKHKNATIANPGTPSITTFYKKEAPSQKEYVQEDILVYHTMRHNHSFWSSDCTAQLTKKLHEPKFSCARTKGQTIVNNIFATWATTIVMQDLDKVEFVSLSIDSSNHGHMRLLPIMVRYCKNDDSMSIEMKLLNFVELKGEKSEELAAEIVVVIQKFSLENNVVAFSADNINTNFGGLNRAERVNVHTKVKRALQRA